MITKDPPPLNLIRHLELKTSSTLTVTGAFIVGSEAKVNYCYHIDQWASSRQLSMCL